MESSPPLHLTVDSLVLLFSVHAFSWEVFLEFLKII